MIFSPEYMNQWEREVFPFGSCDAGVQRDECNDNCEGNAADASIESALCDESEAYFPLWGIVDVDNYLQRSNRARDQAQAHNAQDGFGDAASSGSCGVAPGKAAVQGAAASASYTAGPQHEATFCEGNNRTQEQGVQAYVVPSRKARIAWGVLYWVKRVVIVLVVSVVASLFITMALNPSLTFFDAAHVLLESVTSFLNQSFA